MQFTTRAARRGLAVLGITFAAVLVPTVALAAPGGGPRPSAPPRRSARGGRRAAVRHRRAHRVARHPR